MHIRFIYKLVILILLFEVYAPSLLKAEGGVKEYKILHSPPYNPGMFSVFNTVVGLLHHYEQGKYSGVKVDLKTEGLYYDPKIGPNWWNYYCEPIEVGDSSGAMTQSCLWNECTDMAYFTEFQLSRSAVHRLIQKYIRVKPQIQAKVSSFVKHQFKDHFVIGVHYRGTDKIIEGPRVEYYNVASTLLQYIADYKIKKYKVYVATDEAGFLAFMKTIFGKNVLYIPAFRSETNQPAHVVNTNPYKQGEEALLDCLLLSECQVLFRTTSNLSLWSTYFNPVMPVIMLSKRYNGL